MKEGATDAAPHVPGHGRRGQTLAVLTLAFGSGFGILVLEIVGARLLAPVFGLSTIPWTAIIAVVLTGLAVGNGVGGRLADRDLLPLSWLFILAGFGTLIPVVWYDFPYAAMNRMGFLWGSLTSAIFFFGLPSFLMGCVTPFLIRTDTESLSEVGRRSGDVNGWATGGSIIGTLAAGFLLIPAFSLNWILAGVSASFFLFGALAASLEERRVRVAVCLLFTLLPFAVAQASAFRTAGFVHTTETLYSSIQVVDTEWYPGVPIRELRQNGSVSSAEILETGEPAHRYQITVGWLLADRIESVESVLQLGGAANTLPVALKRWQPQLDITVVEIDPKVVEVARDYFTYGTLPPDALNMVIDDARHFLHRDDGTYDVIICDAYDHLYSVPWTLVTRDAFQEVEARLASDGVYLLTLSTPLQGAGEVFLSRVVATMESVFPAVRVFQTDLEMPSETAQEVVIAAARDPGFLPRVPTLELEVAGLGRPFTDQHAPLEYLQVRRLLADPVWN